MSPRPDPNAERADARRVGEAVARESAAAGQTAAETRAETASAIEASGANLSATDIDRLADGIVERFEARGAFESPPAESTEQLTPEPEQTAAEREAAQRSGEGPPPRKFKPAERFVGRHRQ